MEYLLTKKLQYKDYKHYLILNISLLHTMSYQFLNQYFESYKNYIEEYGISCIPFFDNGDGYVAYSTLNGYETPLLDHISNNLRMNLSIVTQYNDQNIYELKIPYYMYDFTINTILSVGKTVLIIDYDENNSTFNIEYVYEPPCYDSDDESLFDKMKNWFSKLLKIEKKVSVEIDEIISDCCPCGNLNDDVLLDTCDNQDNLNDINQQNMECAVEQEVESEELEHEEEQEAEPEELEQELEQEEEQEVKQVEDKNVLTTLMSSQVIENYATKTLVNKDDEEYVIV